jgi:primosomal protein N' (replication factor Y)
LGGRELIKASRYIQAVVNLPELPEDRLYDYRIPDSWNFTPALGSRVLLPFAGRKVEAVVWGAQKPTYQEQLKEVIAVLDDTPFLTKFQLSLIEWLAQRFFCRRQDLLRLFFPPGLNSRTEKCWQLRGTIEEVEEFLKSIPLNEELRINLWAQLQNLSPQFTPFPAFQNEFSPYVSQLIDAGLVNVSWRPKKPKVTFKTINAYSLTSLKNKRNKISLTDKQKRVCQYLATQEQPVASGEILSATRVTASVLEALCRKGLVSKQSLVIERNPFSFQPSPTPIPILNSQQQTALEKIQLALVDNQATFFLLHGVTGSGKTEVYLRSIAETIKQGKEAILLVPEISLTPQTVERVRARFGNDVAVLHSSLSEGERFDQWWRIKNGEVKVVVGARSAVFAPLPNLGLIIIDEEHEFTYKQEEVPRYHAKEVAKELCRRINGVLILGSATPSLESIYAVEKGEKIKLPLTQRIMGRPMPGIRVVDLRQEFKERRFSVLSPPLKKEIEQRLSLKEQVIILLNRRGYATFIICRECGHVLKCPSCDVTLTFHQKPAILRCHYCNYQVLPPNICPHCQSHYIRYFGHGTQRLEEELTKDFPTARIARMDLDTTVRKGSHERIYRQLVKQEIDILLGTQMVAKGLDLPNVTLVGIITADSGLNLPDFRAAERTYQILTQASGRSGRGEKAGTVIIQTFNPEHYSINALVNQDETAFYQQEIAFRRAANYPPFNYLIRLVFSGLDLKEVINVAQEVTSLLKKQLNSLGSENNQIEIIGPHPAIIEKVKNRFRWHTLIKTDALLIIQRLLPGIVSAFLRSRKRGVRIIIDENPYSVL